MISFYIYTVSGHALLAEESKNNVEQTQENEIILH